MDRCTNTSTHLKGESVFINIKRDTFVSFRLSLTNTSTEKVLISLKSYNNLNLIVGVRLLYYPTQYSSTYINHVSIIDEIYSRPKQKVHSYR